MRCGRTIDPLDVPRATFAAEQDEMFGLSKSSVEYADGRTGWLHAFCFYLPKYRQMPTPTPPREAEDYSLVRPTQQPRERRR